MRYTQPSHRRRVVEALPCLHSECLEWAWLHGVRFQHEKYGDAAPDVDIERTTRRSVIPVASLVQWCNDWNITSTHTASGRLRHREASRGRHDQV
jgi:hypothetical protein